MVASSLKELITSKPESANLEIYVNNWSLEVGFMFVHKLFRVGIDTKPLLDKLERTLRLNE